MKIKCLLCEIEHSVYSGNYSCYCENEARVTLEDGYFVVHAKCPDKVLLIDDEVERQINIY